MGEVLFEIREEHLETGMRGYPVGYCITSTVDPEKGLFYAGQPVSELAGWSPEEVLFLLYFGKKPSESDLRAFLTDLKRRSKVKGELLEAIKRLPREGSPMKLFAASLLLLGMFEGKGDYREESLDLIAKLPEVAAAVICHHAGWEGPKPSDPDLGYMENFTRMLSPPGADPDELEKLFKLFNILHYDHGGGNLSAFIGKGVASGLEDLYGSLAASMLALAGPRHGKANQDCLEFVKQVVEELGEEARLEEVEKLIRERLERGELIYGFGHAVLRVEDPRASIFYRLIEERYPSHPLVKAALLLREAGTKVLKENPKIADPYPNVDAVSGTALSAAGFPYPEYFTLLFGLSRCVGIARQIVYERLEAREGKGTPIIRPKYYYKKS